jgi:ElaB/YqjD/DUF883 family membrane-anchored ribosome-binding protein
MTTTDPDQIRRDIDRTREELSQDVDALAGKASPRRIIRQRRERMTGAVRGARDRIMGTASDTASTVAGGARQAPARVRETAEGNPLAAGLVAFGVGWLVSSLVPASERERRLAARAKDTAMEHADTVKREVGDAAGELRDNLREPAGEAVDAVRSTASDAARTVREDATS